MTADATLGADGQVNHEAAPYLPLGALHSLPAEEC